MVFYAYLDPAVIERAYQRQPYGYQCLIAMLRGFIQNCCIMDRNGAVKAGIANQVRKLRNDSDRKMLDTILRFLNRHNRFIDETEDADVIVSESNQTDSVGAGRSRGEVCSLANYQFTDFEHKRCMSAHGGVTLGFGQFSAKELLSRHFLRALQYARHLQIYDGSLGPNCSESYRYTVDAFLNWFRQVNPHATQYPVQIHSREPKGEKQSERQALLRDIRALGVEITFYRHLPHDRFILTDQFALEIGRGMDFLDLYKGCNRDVSIATKDLRQVKSLLQSYDRHQLPRGR